jgi:polyisoprenoid-binding protein YceI
VVAAAALLAACATTVEVPPPAAPGRPAGFPDAYYQEATSRGAPVFRVDPARSRVVIVVRRGGTLSHLGHDHVVASHDLGGYIAPEAGRADLVVPLASLVVDEAVLRLEIGLDTQPSEADIAGTRRNMQDKVLETDRFPYATVAVSGLPPGGDTQPVPVAVSLHGVTRVVEVPLQFRHVGDDLTTSGSFAIDQSQFGIVPFSILGGAIAVQDRVDISFRIVATRAR